MLGSSWAQIGPRPETAVKRTPSGVLYCCQEVSHTRVSAEHHTKTSKCIGERWRRFNMVPMRAMWCCLWHSIYVSPPTQAHQQLITICPKSMLKGIRDSWRAPLYPQGGSLTWRAYRFYPLAHFGEAHRTETVIGAWAWACLKPLSK